MDNIIEKAMSPLEIKEAVNKKGAPVEITRAINELLVEKYSSGKIRLTLSDIKTRTVQIWQEINGYTADNYDWKAVNWDTVDEAFKKAGWQVSWDAAGYCESYPTTVSFLPK